MLIMSSPALVRYSASISPSAFFKATLVTRVATYVFHAALHNDLIAACAVIAHFGWTIN